MEELCSSSNRSARRPRSSSPSSTPHASATTCASRRSSAAAGLGVEVYPEPKKLGKQLQYADKRGFRVAVVAGEREFAAGECQVKNLASGTSTTVSLPSGRGGLSRRNSTRLGEVNSE